jgi:branched-chain amino acid transport system permease protein
MSAALFVVQTLNGLALGILLFLIASGLTLIFGIMNFVNLAHGVQYMLGAYFAVGAYALTDNFLAAAIIALIGTLVCGLALDRLIFRHLYQRDHLDQVLATFGVILAVNEAVRIAFGSAPLSLPMPEALSGTVRLFPPVVYPIYRLVLIGAGLLVAGLLYWLVNHTRLGMQVRAGAVNAPLVSALGIDIGKLFRNLFGFGSMLAGFAGLMAAPILSIEPNMGDGLMILAFVVVVIGGIGSIRGAFVAALIIGLVDTLGRSFASDLCRFFFAPSTANQVGPALASMAIYVLMAGVLFVKPTGLFPVAR